MKDYEVKFTDKDNTTRYLGSISTLEEAKKVADRVINQLDGKDIRIVCWTAKADQVEMSMKEVENLETYNHNYNAVLSGKLNSRKDFK